MDVPRARAFVNSVHIMKLKRRLSRKNICIMLESIGVLRIFANTAMSWLHNQLTIRTTNSTPPSMLDRPIVVATHVANEVVNSVVVLIASLASSLQSLEYIKSNYIQLCKHPVERGTCPARNGQHNPLRLLAQVLHWYGIGSCIVGSRLRRR